jgi:predicted outer membrane repeat protein
VAKGSHVDYSVSYSKFTGNTALGSGGSLYNAERVSFSEFNGNFAVGKGGAISFDSFISSSKVANSIFISNKSESDGGAIDVEEDSLIMNNLFINNHAQKGGAISKTQHNTSSTNNIYVNNTFAKNTAIESGGAFYGIGNIYNSIFSENTADGENNDIHSTGDAGDFILDFSLFSIVTGAVDIRPGFILGDPLFVDAEKGDYRLRADSPSINAGDNSFSSDDYALFLKSLSVDNLIDLDNVPRIQDGRIDMGAYEFQ